MPPAVLHLHPDHAAGGGPGIVAVPGIGLSVDVPAVALRRLAPTRRGVVVALPGYGEPAPAGVEIGPGALLLCDYRHTGLRSMARAMHAARRHRIDRVLRSVRVDVLVVRGRHDRIAPAGWTAALAAVAPRGRAVTLAAGAHMVPVTHPALLAAAVSAFLG